MTDTKNTLDGALFDLDTVDTVEWSNNGALIQLKDPSTKKPLPIFIRVVGKHSDTFRNILKDRTDRRIRDAEAAASRGEELPARTVDEQERDAIDLLTACTLEWYTMKGDGEEAVKVPQVFFKKKAHDFTVPNVRDFYKSVLFAREQVDAFMARIENFTPAT